MGAEIWNEPVHGGHFPPELFGLPGIEQIRLILNGKVAIPPIGHLTGMHPTEVGAGSATFVMPITGWLQTPQGLMTAGEIAILADGPLGCAIQTVLPAATGYTTTELSINMVRPSPKQGQLVARGRVVHCGRQLGLSETFVTDGAGRLIAHGTSRCAIFPPQGEGPPPPTEMAAIAPEDPGWVAPF
ncbi:MAG: PaaI family thioesterase, partial [Acidimicrobiales bacterium]